MTNAVHTTTVRSHRIATVEDLTTVSKIHKVAYSAAHFTALLSESVLKRYYAGFLSGGTEICLAIDSEIPGGTTESVVGFSVYGVGIPDKIAAFKVANRKDILATSLRYPWTAGRKAIKAGLAKFDGQPPYPPADFLLLSIAVARPMSGVGKLLMDETLAVARAQRHSIAGLYVNDENVRAINTYFGAGFRIKDFQGGQYYMEANL